MNRALFALVTAAALGCGADSTAPEDSYIRFEFKSWNNHAPGVTATNGTYVLRVDSGRVVFNPRAQTAGETIWYAYAPNAETPLVQYSVAFTGRHTLNNCVFETFFPLGESPEALVGSDQWSSGTLNLIRAWKRNGHEVSANFVYVRAEGFPPCSS